MRLSSIYFKQKTGTTMKQFIALFIFISSINISLASEHRDPKVAHELFTVMKMSKTYQQTIEKMVDVQVAGNPNIKPLKPVCSAGDTMRYRMGHVWCAPCLRHHQ